MNDHYINNTLSALVMLGAVALTYTTYSSYKAEMAIDKQEQAPIAMDQAANAFLSFKAKAALQATTVSTTTEENSTTTKAKTQ
jgi:hypothetical protein